MYHIPNDARAVKSSELLLNSLIDLMNRKNFVDITVKELVNASGVSRATYYRLFDNITDILSWKLDTLIISSIDKIKMHPSKDFKHIFYEFIQYWDNHRDFINGLIKAGRSNLIYETHINHIDDIQKYMFSNKVLNDMQKEYLAEYLAALIPITFRVSEKYPEKEKEKYYDDIVGSIAMLWHFLS